MLYQILKEKFREEFKENFYDEKINVRAKLLSNEEAIGNPEHKDYPLLKGKERLINAEYKGSSGVAFTDSFGDYEGTLKEIFTMPLDNNFRRAIFIASINAVLKHEGVIEKTMHCRDEEPVLCAQKLTGYIKENHGSPEIFMAGFQPRFAEELSKEFSLKICDLDKDNIGKKINGAEVFHSEKEDEFINSCGLIFATGSAFANNTALKYIESPKPVLFFGVTCAAPCYLLNSPRFCESGK